MTAPAASGAAEPPPSAASHASAWRIVVRAVTNVPRWVLMGVLMAWRRLVSPLYGPVCRFYPSCSAYALEAVTVHGAVRGVWLTVRRLLRCNPFHGGGVDHVPHGDRVWPEGRTPRIVRINHPPIPADQQEPDGTSPIEHRHRAA